MPPFYGKPPAIGAKLLKAFCSDEICQEKLGDFEELYHLRARQSGKTRASLWYVLQILRFLRAESELSFYWGFSLFRNYVIIAARNLRRHKGYSLINIAGLALGITAFLFISVWVLHQVSFDRFHENASSLYRVIGKRDFPDGALFSTLTPGPLSPAMKDSFPEVRDAVRLAWTGERVIRSGKVIHYEDAIATVDADFFRVFSFPFIKGDKEAAFESLYSIVITEDTARKYFGNRDPMGKVLTLDNTFDFTVSGVIGNVPSNSSLRFDMAVPFDIVERLGWAADRWDFSLATTFLHLAQSADVGAFEGKAEGFVKNFDADTNIELCLQPLVRMHLFSNFDGQGNQGGIQYVLVFSFVAVLILILACINFMNLSTARSERRAREIGMRKVIGASRRHLIRQFLIEAVFIAFTALLAVPVLVLFFLPAFNRMTEGTFSLESFGNPSVLIIVLGVTLFTGILSGSYPALYLSSFQPVKVFRRRPPARTGGVRMRKVLVVFQVGISLFLIACSLTIYRQIDFLKNKDLGFDKDHVISLPLGISNAANSEIYARFREEAKHYPQVEQVSASFTHPSWFSSPTKNVVYNGRRLDERIPVSITSVEYGFIETLKLEVVKGRSFARDFPGERGSLIVNETFERLMETETALSQTLSIGERYSGTIIGVVKDFHMESVSEAQIAPLILFQNPSVNYIFVRVRPDNLPGALENLEKAWNKTAPDLPFNYNFLDRELNEFYVDVEKLGSVLKSFTLLAGFIACLGLLGLTSFATEKRTKEIGVRKVLGASVRGLVSLLCWEQLKLVLLANLFAWPAAWLVLSGWLKNFAYHVSFEWTTVFCSGLLVAGVALIAVSFQTVRASLASPVHSLRCE